MHDLVMHDLAHHRAAGNADELDSARAGRARRRRRPAVLVALWIALWPLPTFAHDPSAWGGLFRTRDVGATWSPVNPGSFVSGAIALAVSPVDPHHLLLATDSGVSRSRNGGRDWEIEAPEVLIGAAFAAALDTDGQRALVSMGSAIFRNDGDGWRAIGTPAGAEPARALVADLLGRVYLVGWSGLYRSDDWGTSWTRASDGLPEGPVNALAVAPAPAEGLFAIAAGRLWASFDGARHWQPRDAGLPSGAVEAFALDPSDSGRMWATAAGQLFHSPGGGGRWQVSRGRPLPERNARARGLAVSGPVIVVATDRGVYRSLDGGERWEPPDENLPGHLEAGLLVRDPVSPSTIYTGFTLTVQDELRRRVAEGRSPLMRLSVSNLAGGAAFLALLTLGAIVVLRRLVRTSYRTPPGEPPPPEAARAPGSRQAAR